MSNTTLSSITQRIKALLPESRRRTERRKVDIALPANMEERHGADRRREPIALYIAIAFASGVLVALCVAPVTPFATRVVQPEPPELTLDVANYHARLAGYSAEYCR